MQLNFLGEEFDARKCNKMCDNCKKGLKLIHRDATPDALKIIQMITELNKYNSNVTLR